MSDHVFGKFVLTGHWEFRKIENTPPVPDSLGAANVYLKDDNLVIQYNNDGTAYYKSLDLAGTVATWTHGTAAP